MKYYIFLTPAVGNIGGSQLFISNKLKVLENNGWETDVLFFQDYQIQIDNLKRFEKNYIPMLANNPLYLANFEIKKVIKSITKHYKEIIPDNTPIYIESHTYNLLFWAEIIAKEINGIHISNLIDEEPHPLNDSLHKFYEFKLYRREWMNAGIDSLHRFFGPYYKKDYEDFVFDMIPLCSNVYSDTRPLHQNLPKCDYCIMSIGRLDKAYIIEMVNEIKNFISFYKEKIINLVFIGASPDNKIENWISDNLHNLPNCNIFFWGFLFPIPINYVQIADVVIATSNSVLIGANLGIPTIAVDANDHHAIGVYGYTTNRKVFRGDEPKIKISFLLKDILIEHKFIKKEKNNKNITKENSAIQPQIDFIKNITPNKEYYDIFSLVNPLFRLFINIKRLLLSIYNYLFKI